MERPYRIGLKFSRGIRIIKHFTSDFPSLRAVISQQSDKTQAHPGYVSCELEWKSQRVLINSIFPRSHSSFKRIASEVQ